MHAGVLSGDLSVRRTGSGRHLLRPHLGEDVGQQLVEPLRGLDARHVPYADELLDLARDVRDGVFDAFGVTLRPEPVLVNCAI